MPYTAFENTDIQGLNDNLLAALANIPGGTINSGLSTELVTADPSDNTLSNLYTAFGTWKADHPNARIVSVTAVTGGDGETGLLVIYI